MINENDIARRTILNQSALALDPEQEVNRIVHFLRETIHHRFHHQGAVVGISGGVDSSVVLSLCVRAIGPERVIGVLMPEKDSASESTPLALELAEGLGVQTEIEDITGALEGLGCYRRRDEAVKKLVPEFESDWHIKIILSGNLLEQETLNFYTLVVTDPQGNEIRKRLPPNLLAQILAASNFKQRVRMNMLYYHAELRRFCVIGTANKNEHELGFFVKHGDGGVDLNPIVHLFKSQVFQLADYLGIPEKIRSRTPTTDTFPGAGSQEEFFYRIPYHVLDSIWSGYEQNAPLEEIAKALSLNTEQVQRVIDDIIRKKRATKFLRTIPVRIDDGLSDLSSGS